MTNIEESKNLQMHSRDKAAVDALQSWWGAAFPAADRFPGFWFLISSLVISTVANPAFMIMFLFCWESFTFMKKDW